MLVGADFHNADLYQAVLPASQENLPVSMRRILREHHCWIITSGDKGTRADLSGAHLEAARIGGANLDGANLSATVFDSCNLNPRLSSIAVKLGATVTGGEPAFEPPPLASPASPAMAQAA